MIKLEPCPFCWQKDNKLHKSLESNGVWWVITCAGCGLERTYKSKEQAIRAWNARPVEDALKTEVEMLKEALSDIAKIGFEGKIGDKVARKIMRRIANSAIQKEKTE